MSVWKGSSRVVLIDAMGSKSPTGDAIVAFRAHEKPLPAEFERSSTHGMGPMESIELARALGELPSYLLVVGIAAADFSLGNELSEDTALLIPEAVKQIGEFLKGEAHA